MRRLKNHNHSSIAIILKCRKAFLHHNLHRHNLPATDVEINTVVTTATTTKRAMEQELTYPKIDPNTMRLIRTSLGLAEIESMEVNLTTRETKLKVCLS